MGKIKIGLEIHMHLKTKQKLFCKCKIPSQNEAINTTICPICTGQPGSKPMLPNEEALKSCVRLAKIFGSKITPKTNFQRKHYTWPDMPTGFQKTVSGAHVIPTAVGGEFLGIKIEELHLEEDPASWDPQTGEINYNRAGFPLAEIVTKPDFTSTEQLRDWLKELILVSEYLGAINDEYGIKSDVNVSIEESNFQRVEIKNVSSLTNIVAAAETEIQRQRDLVSTGAKISQETRRYNEALNTTEFMRSKENAQDYMFIPEPDLPSTILEPKYLDSILVPETPAQKREKYAKYNLSKEDVEVIVSNLYLSGIFEYAIEKKLNPREVGLFLRREIPRVLNYNKATFSDLENKNIHDEIVSLISLLGGDKISYQTAQKVWEKLFDEKFNVEEYIKKNGLIQVQDTSLIEKLVEKALKDAPKAVADYKSGNTKALNFVVGIVMRESKGTAKPQLVNEIMEKKVKEL